MPIIVGVMKKDFAIILVEDQIDDTIDWGIEYDEEVGGIWQQIEYQRVRHWEGLYHIYNQGLKQSGFKNSTPGSHQSVTSQEEDNDHDHRYRVISRGGSVYWLRGLFITHGTNWKLLLWYKQGTYLARGFLFSMLWRRRMMALRHKRNRNGNRVIITMYM